jgi:hypothetical protein
VDADDPQNDVASTLQRILCGHHGVVSPALNKTDGPDRRKEPPLVSEPEEISVTGGLDYSQ